MRPTCGRWTEDAIHHDAIRDLRLALGLLRQALQRLIENETFSQHFADKESIDRLFAHQAPPVFSRDSGT